MTALTYQKDARAYRFSLPNEIWGLKLPPPTFSILAYLCYLNSHHKGDAVPSVDEIAALLHMSPDMAEKQLDTLVKRNLISPQMVPVFSRKHTGKFSPSLTKSFLWTWGMARSPSMPTCSTAKTAAAINAIPVTTPSPPLWSWP